MAQSAPVVTPHAQTRPIGQVTVDLAARAFDRILPFDVPFFIAGRAPAGTTTLDVQYAVMRGEVSQLRWMPIVPARWQPGEPSSADQPFLVLVRAALEPRQTYEFRFVFRSDSSRETTAIVEGRTEQKNYVSVDMGVLYAGALSRGALYVGSNIYFRPINKTAPLGAGSGIGRRLALTVGVTISSIGDENNKTRSDLFWNQSLVIGAGVRLASSVRAGAGALVFREADPNPLVTSRSAATTWYVSFSFDLDLLRGFIG
jgi:hypothetical protein